MEGPKYQIFVSSTYEDLKDERDTVMKAVLEIGHIPVGMELFSAGNEEQWELIKRNIDDCDYYVIVIAHRYGSKDGAVSYTEKEYEYAVSKNVPVLGFIIDNSAEWPAARMDTAPEDREALSAFKDRVKRKIVQFWKNRDELHGKVAIALGKAFRAYPRPGWVRASPDLGPAVTRELTRLSEENAQLRAQLSEAREKAEADESTRFRELTETLRRNKRKVSLFYRSEGAYVDAGETTLLAIFVQAAPFLLVERGFNGLNSSLAYYLREKARDGNDTLRAVAPLPNNFLQVWLADFVALGLVEPSSRKHQVADKEQYWSLTDLGRSFNSYLRMRLGLDAKADQDSSESDTPKGAEPPEQA